MLSITATNHRRAFVLFAWMIAACGDNAVGGGAAGAAGIAAGTGGIDNAAGTEASIAGSGAGVDGSAGITAGTSAGTSAQAGSGGAGASGTGASGSGASGSGASGSGASGTGAAGTGAAGTGAAGTGGPGVCGGDTPHGCYTPASTNTAECAPQIHEQTEGFVVPGNEWVACGTAGNTCKYAKPMGGEASCVCDTGVHWICLY